MPGNARAEPKDSQLCKGIQQRSYPVVERSGILWAWLGEGAPPAFPEDRLLRGAPTSHTFAFKGHMACKLAGRRSKSASIPRTPPICIVFFEDEDTSKSYGQAVSAAPPPAATCR